MSGLEQAESHLAIWSCFSLTQNTRSIRTFDEYKSELEQGQLSWTPPHKNDDFWRENAQKLNDKDRALLK